MSEVEIHIESMDDFFGAAMDMAKRLDKGDHDVAALLHAGLIERASDGKVAVPWSRVTAEMAVDVAA